MRIFPCFSYACQGASERASGVSSWEREEGAQSPRINISSGFGRANLRPVGAGRARVWVVATPLLLWHFVPVRDARSSCLKIFALVCRCDDGCPQMMDRARPLRQPCPLGTPPWCSPEPGHSDVKWRSLPWFCSDMSHSWMRRPFAFPVLRLSAVRLQHGYAPKHLWSHFSWLKVQKISALKMCIRVLFWCRLHPSHFI